MHVVWYEIVFSDLLTMSDFTLPVMSASEQILWVMAANAKPNEQNSILNSDANSTVLVVSIDDIRLDGGVSLLDLMSAITADFTSASPSMISWRAVAFGVFSNNTPYGTDHVIHVMNKRIADVCIRFSIDNSVQKLVSFSVFKRVGGWRGG